MPSRAVRVSFDYSIALFLARSFVRSFVANVLLSIKRASTLICCCFEIWPIHAPRVYTRNIKTTCIIVRACNYSRSIWKCVQRSDGRGQRCHRWYIVSVSRFAYSNQQLINRWTCLNERLNVCSPYHHHQSTRRRLCNNNNEATNNVLTTTTTTFFFFFVFLLEIVSHTVRPSVRPSVVVLLIVQRWTVDELRFIISEAVQLLFIVTWTLTS